MWPAEPDSLAPETEYILKRFNTSAPKYINDVRVQVADIDIRKIDGVCDSISLKQAMDHYAFRQYCDAPGLKS